MRRVLYVGPPKRTRGSSPVAEDCIPAVRPKSAIDALSSASTSIFVRRLTPFVDAPIGLTVVVAFAVPRAPVVKNDAKK